jgi:type IV pilus assembly protein PilM
MVRWIGRKQYGPIGVDLGSRSVKLVQLSADRSTLIASARWDLPNGSTLDASGEENPEQFSAELAKAVRSARESRDFRGRDAVICLGSRELFVQNVRLTPSTETSLETSVHQEAASRLPFSVAEAEIRFLQAGDVRQGDLTRREVIMLACHRPVLKRTLETVEAAGLRPVVVDIEPSALLRCYAAQFRRDEDRQQRAMFVHVGTSNTAVVIAQGADPLFVKYIDVGGSHLDHAVARHLKIELSDAASLRRHNGDRRADQQDPEVASSVATAVRGVIERLTQELSMCVRYHSVTFRGQPLVRLVLGGGEASETLLDVLQKRLDMPCEIGDPLRLYNDTAPGGQRGQWDVAAGLALREID